MKGIKSGRSRATVGFPACSRIGGVYYFRLRLSKTFLRWHSVGINRATLMSSSEINRHRTYAHGQKIGYNRDYEPKMENCCILKTLGVLNNSLAKGNSLD